jgi:hypothetical protein
MSKNSIYGKISIVVFLTGLIWVWADLAQDERLTLSNVVTLSVARSSDQTLWLSFVDSGGVVRPPVMIDSIDLKGPASTVADVDRMRNKGELEGGLFLDPVREGLVEEGTRVFDVLSFLRQNDTIKQLGLTVESCEPRTLTVQVRRLVEKRLLVECVDENGVPLKAEVEPAEVSAFVVADETVVAKVRLSASEQAQARESAIEKTPYVELPSGQRRDVSTPVRVTLSPAEDVLRDENVQATLGFCFSPNLQGRYRVELQNESELTSAILKIKATPAAKQAYEQQPFQIFLPILDEDARPATDVIARRVDFNFPEEYVGRGEIRGAGEAAPEARFRLVPVPAAAAAADGS